MRLLILFLIPAILALSAGDEALAREMLPLHNHFRATLKLKPLVWSDRVAATAQDWANTLLMTGHFAHRPKNKYGENLYEVRGRNATAAEAFEAWASEAKMYDYKSNTCHQGGPCGHYTQIVWANTRELGCAVARSPSREVWVCNYNPPGNYIGQRPY
jgi:uncharacterized protein YkwD